MKQGQVKILTKPAPIVVSVEIPETREELQKGLGGRNELKIDSGMLFDTRSFLPKPAVMTMQGMNFPLDFIYIRDGMVIGIKENVSNKRLMKAVIGPPSDYVLEVGAGFVHYHFQSHYSATHESVSISQ